MLTWLQILTHDALLLFVFVFNFDLMNVGGLRQTWVPSAASCLAHPECLDLAMATFNDSTFCFTWVGGTNTFTEILVSNFADSINEMSSEEE